MKIPESVIHFFQRQPFVFVATIADDGVPNVVPKGICHIDGAGTVYVVDLYRGRTKENLTGIPEMTIAAVDERLYAGFQLKGTATWIPVEEETEHREHLEAWKKKVSERITSRIIENVQTQYRTQHHEAHFPEPEGIIKLTVEQIVNLAEHREKQRK